MNLVLSREDLKKLDQILVTELVDNGIDHTFVVDISGNLIAEAGTFDMGEILPLAALSAINYMATERIADLIGEKDFSLVFHKGTNHHIHSCRIDKDFILVSVFGNDVSVGLVRLASRRVSQQMLPILQG